MKSTEKLAEVMVKLILADPIRQLVRFRKPIGETFRAGATIRIASLWLPGDARMAPKSFGVSCVRDTR